MKKLILSGLTLVLATGGWASTYLRPQAAYIMPEESGADSAVGVFLALGFAPAEHAQHEFELELGWAQWDFDESGTARPVKRAEGPARPPRS